MSRPPYRKDGKRGAPRDAGKRFHKRRAPVPPPETGREAGFWEEKKTGRTPVVFSLSGGRTVQGIVTEFDQEMVTVEPSDGPSVFIRKSDIRYIEVAG